MILFNGRVITLAQALAVVRARYGVRPGIAKSPRPASLAHYV